MQRMAKISNILNIFIVGSSSLPSCSNKAGVFTLISSLSLFFTKVFYFSLVAQNAQNFSGNTQTTYDHHL